MAVFVSISYTELLLKVRICFSGNKFSPLRVNYSQTCVKQAHLGKPKSGILKSSLLMLVAFIPGLTVLGKRFSFK